MNLKNLGRLAPKLLMFIIFMAIILPASGFLANLTPDQYLAWLIPVGVVVLSCLAAIAVIMAVAAWWRGRKGEKTPEDGRET
jgi:membrane protein implicated in regulation of membrane protease activity